jgi:hypothetical protein
VFEVDIAGTILTAVHSVLEIALCTSDNAQAARKLTIVTALAREWHGKATIIERSASLRPHGATVPLSRTSASQR